MAVLQLAEPSEDVKRVNVYNRNIGGAMRHAVSFSVPPDTPWCVFGCVLVPAATPDDIESTLIPAVVSAVDVIDSIHGDCVYGRMPSDAIASNHECRLHVTARILQQLDGAVNQQFSSQGTLHRSVPLPLDAKWVAMAAQTTAALDQASIDNMVSQINGISGVVSAAHLIDDYVGPRVNGVAQLSIQYHLRYDAIEV